MRLGKSLIATAIVISILSSNNLMMAKDTTTKNTKIEKVVTTKDFEFKDGVITKYVGKGGKVVIPSTINGQKVVKIGDKAFFNCSSIKNIIIPNSVTSIGESAFDGCCNLESITLPNELTQIRYATFAGCTKLANVIIPNTVTNIDACAFSTCKSLTSITIPDNVTNIGYYAFSGCLKLKSVKMSDSVSVIGDTAFFECIGLTDISLSNRVTVIGKNTFGFCESLKSITIPDSVTSIGESAFTWCENLTQVKISDSITNIGENAFKGCSSLTSITIPDNVIRIGENTFSQCGKLRNISYGGTTYTHINELINSSNGKIQVLTPADTKDEVESTEEPQTYTDNSPQSVFDRGGKISEIDDSFKQSFKSIEDVKKIFPNKTNDEAKYVLENKNYVVAKTELRGTKMYRNGEISTINTNRISVTGSNVSNGVIVFKDGTYCTSSTLPDGKTLKDINYFAYSSGSTYLIVKVTDVDMTGMWEV